VVGYPDILPATGHDACISASTTTAYYTDR